MKQRNWFLYGAAGVLIAIGLYRLSDPVREIRALTPEPRVVEILVEEGVIIYSIDGHLYGGRANGGSLVHLESCPEDHR